MWEVPGSSRIASAPTFAVSTQTICRHSSAPKSGKVFAFSAHGFHTTVDREPDLLTTSTRDQPGSSMRHVAVVADAAARHGRAGSRRHRRGDRVDRGSIPSGCALTLAGHYVLWNAR